MEEIAFESDNSFPAKFKIKTPRDFRNILAKGTKTHSKNFILYTKNPIPWVSPVWEYP